MEIYLVGGAVRDRLLGLPPRERDWVVVGADAERLSALGFRPVGKDFPVFLHPQTREEYALARTERKTAPGYHGFDFDAAPTVTLEQDLRRRDLTINAMAEDAEGRLIDPWGGQRDLRERVLRHVSPAFAEDPVRILRVARFAARYAPLGFRVAEETLALMRHMVEAGEVDALVAERVWQELHKALAEAQPSAFVTIMRQCGALRVLLPEVEALFGVPQPPRHHPEIDTGEHLLMALDQAARAKAGPRVGFAVLCHDLGKGLTPPPEWPRHIAHEERADGPINAICDRLRAPRAYRELALLCARYHTHCHRALELRPTTLLRLLDNLDALRRPERFAQFLEACTADARGRQGRHDVDYPQAERLRAALAAVSAVDAAELVAGGLKGTALGTELQRRRLRALRALPAPSAQPGLEPP